MLWKNHIIMATGLIATSLSWGCATSETGDWTCQASTAAAEVYRSAHNNVFPSVAWTGESALLVWNQVPPDLSPATVWMLPLDTQGIPLADAPVTVVEEEIIFQAQVVWTGQAAVVIWVENDAPDCIMTRAHDAFGTPLAAAQSVQCMEDSNGHPRMVVDGEEIILGWATEGDDEDEEQPLAMVMRLDATGSALTEPVTFAIPEVGLEGITLGVDADGPLVAWGSWDGIFLARIDDQGAVTSREQILPPPDQTEEWIATSSLASDGSAITWTWTSMGSAGESEGPVLHMAELDGMTAVGDIELSSSEDFVARPSDMIAGPTGLRAMAWTHGDFDFSNVQLAVVGPDGNHALEPTLINATDETLQIEPGVGALPDGFLVVWRSSVAGEADGIRVQKVGCSAN